MFKSLSFMNSLAHFKRLGIFHVTSIMLALLQLLLSSTLTHLLHHPGGKKKPL